MGKHSFTYKFSAILLGAFVACALISCEDRGTDEASSYAAYVNVTNPSFSQLSAAVLVPKCVGCHSEFRTEEGLASALSAGDPDHSSLFQMVDSGQMPKGAGPLPRSLVKMIRAYIQNAGEAPPIDLKNVTFEVLNQKIFAPKCLKCHSEFSTEAGILAEVEPGDRDNSIIYNFVADGKMPKGGRLSANNIEAIGVWIDGLPQKTYPQITPTFASLKANLFERSCVQCHSTGASRMASKIPFDGWDDVTDYDKEILAKMQDPKKPMPLFHSTLPASPAVIQAYSDWLKAGEPNN